jgi:Ca2+-binding RTX toxin-like protein
MSEHSSGPPRSFRALCLTLILGATLWLGAANALAKETIVVQSGSGLYTLVGKELTKITGEDADGFGVSPDGAHVVLTPWLGEYGGAVLIVDANTKEVDVVSTPAESGMSWSQIRYAPNGEQVVGRAYSEATEAYGIYAMDTDGTDVRKLVSEGEWPVMSSQGTLAYLAGSRESLYVVDPSPSGESIPRKLASGGFYGQNGGRPTFSPDGSSILFPRESNRVYVVSVATGKTFYVPSVGPRAEWETESTVLDAAVWLYRRSIFSFKSTVLSESSTSWVRSNQPGGKVAPPEAIELPSCKPIPEWMIVNESRWVNLGCTGPGLTYELDSEPSHGEITEFSSKWGELLYTPEKDFVGTDSVKFHAENEDGETESVTLTLEVRPASCEPRESGTGKEEPVPVSLLCFGPWLEPESEEEEWEPEPITYEIASSPEHGEISEFSPSTGELIYTPDPEFEGDDEFTYRGTDSHGSSPVVPVEIVVGGAPECDDALVKTEPGEPVAISLKCLRVAGESSSVSIIEGPSDGDIDEFESEDGTLVYQPDVLFLGRDSFTFKAENWAGESNEATATVQVCSRPVVKASGEALDPETPGVDLSIEVEPGYPECEIDETFPEVTGLSVFVDDELVYSEERQCGDVENPCGRKDWQRQIQLPYTAVVGTHDIRIEASDQFGNEAKPLEQSATTPAEGTVSQLPPEAEDSKGSEGCKTPKNRFKRYVFRGKVVHGTPCADKLYSYPQRGTTIYIAGDGDDIVMTGGEINTIRGGAGNDRLYAGRGNDSVFGGADEDQIAGGSGDDTLLGQGGNDIVSGASGSDVSKGNDGNDLIRGGTTADSLFGGLNTDTVSFADAVTPGFEFGSFLTGFPASRDGRGVYLNLSEETKKDAQGREYVRAFNGSTARFAGGADKIYVSDGGFENVVGSPFADYLGGSSAANLIDGSGGTDILTGATGADLIYGGADSDMVDGGADQGAGSLHGGPGDDICVNGGESEPCERESSAEGLKAVSAAITIGSVNPDDAPNDLGVFVRGTTGKDVITATWDAKGGQVDLLAKGAIGFDLAANGVSGCTVEKEGEKESTAANAHCPIEAVQTIVIDGNDGNDVLKARSVPGAVSVTLLGGSGNDSLLGGNTSEDILVDGPDSGKDDLYGFGDDDTLLANDGRDRLFGAEGSDLFVSSAICEGDRIKGGSGAFDNASWAQLRGEAIGETGEFKAPDNGVNASIFGGAGDISRNGGKCEEEGKIDGIEFLEGSGGDDLLEGDNAHNIILGRSGKDELFGEGGTDSILANNRDPNGETKEEQEDPDASLECGSSGGDVANIDPADKPVVDEDCERVNPNVPPAQARVSGIGGDPVIEARTTSADEEVIGGLRDPDVLQPVAFYRFDEASGTSAENWSDEEAPGAYSEGAAPDQPGAMEDSRAVQLDGESDYVDLTEYWDPSEFFAECGNEVDGYSVEMWVKFADEAGVREELFSRAEGDEGVFLYRGPDGKLSFSMVDQRESPTISTDDPVDDGEWHHVVASIARQFECEPTLMAMSLSPEEEPENETRLTLSVDGFSYALGLDVSSSIPTSISSASNVVGARDGEGGFSNWLAGTVDGVAIYDRPLAEDEVQEHLLIGDAPLPVAILLPPVDPEDGDIDEDGVADSVDNCPGDSNADQEDTDADGVGDACQVEPDSDEDEVPDEADNCPEDANAWQEDSDENGIGDVCEPE